MVLKELKNIHDAQKLLKFFFDPNLFSWKLPDFEIKQIKERVNNALYKKNKCSYWFFENENHSVIGAGAAQEDGQGTGGFFIGWLAVNTKNRRKGLGSKIINKIEDYVKKNGGRYIIADTNDDNIEAKTFYHANGYKVVGLIPDAYKEGVGKVLYYKKIGM